MTWYPKTEFGKEMRRKERRIAARWVARQEGELKTMLGEMRLMGFEFLKNANYETLKMEGPDNAREATLLRARRTRIGKRVDFWAVNIRQIGWTSGLYEESTDALQKYLDKWWRDEDQEKGVG